MMLYSVVHITVGMASFFREPVFQLGVRASELMEAFYQAIQPTQRLMLSDLLTFGGNSYGDLKLTINTFGGGGRIDITAGALIVDLRNVGVAAGHAKVAKEHMQLCEDTLRTSLTNVEISERLMRANLWVACEGGSEAVEVFLEQKGNAALKLDHGTYANLKKEFTIQFAGLDAARATKVGLALERSIGEGDLFVRFDHTRYGNPSVMQSVEEQFAQGERELEALLRHVGLEARTNNASRP